MLVLKSIADWLWGPPLLLLIVGGGLFVALRLGFVQLRHFGYIMNQTFGRMFSKVEAGEGTVSQFQAACSALASSIGAANIVVVPTIIYAAGPGAVFWMWVAALVGMSTKFSEICLGIKYRFKNEDGEYVGGPAYYLKNGVGGTAGKILGFSFAFFLMIEILPSITIQTHSAIGPLIDMGVNHVLAAGIVFVLVFAVAFGGIKRIGKVTEIMVPFMALAYVCMAMIILIMHASAIPEAIKNIFVGAFAPSAVAGGSLGGTLLLAMQKGVARGVYSNEAGMGEAAYAHSTATVDHPVRQGFWGVFEVSVDTLVVCSMSALVVLTTGVWKDPSKSATAVYTAFVGAFGTIGALAVSASLFLFVLSTIIVIVFYCEKQAEYLFGSTVGKIMRLIASLMVLATLFIDFKNAGFLLDLALALAVIPNMIGVVWLSGEVKELKDQFFSDPRFYEPLRKKI